jgi:hypothetical protein
MQEPMKALEFEARLNPDHTLTVPAELAAQLPGGAPVRVLLLVPAADEEQEWKRLAAEQFFKGYAEGDAIYDELSGG